ncbi:MAG: LysR family transcriptional regulator [Nannocystaceae bacterium]|nr:LysR family transcriptional regulator [Nannocystaceae bacterium]
MANLTSMQTFIEVAKAGSFAEAARRLSLPRSTVSTRVRTLEDRLQTRLLHRTTRRISLTEEGARYLERCEEIVARLAEIEADFGPADQLAGQLRVTIPVDMTKTALASQLVEFSTQHPALSIEVLVTDDALDLVENRIDLALRGGAPGSAGLVARRLGRGRLGLVASPHYLERHPITTPLSSLAEHRLLDPTGRGTSLGPALRAPVTTSSFELAKQLATQAAGVALLPTSLCEEELAAGSLRELPWHEELPELAMYLVMSTREHVPPRVRALIDFLVARAQTPQRSV